ncbi:MAG: 4Fe-4S binding protein, partial [Anaerolineae bacterium]|nr:4Fe-4S binding protein [Anaerolineae bacterium]
MGMLRNHLDHSHTEICKVGNAGERVPECAHHIVTEHCAIFLIKGLTFSPRDTLPQTGRLHPVGQPQMRNSIKVEEVSAEMPETVINWLVNQNRMLWMTDWQQDLPVPMIDLERCNGCELCVHACPTGA